MISSAVDDSRRTRLRMPQDERVTAILAAARLVLAEKGYERTVIADIAARAGIVDGTIYRYFKNKRDLLVQVAEIWFGEKLSGDSGVGAINGTRDKLRHLALRTLGIIRSDPVLSRFLLIELRPDPDYRSTPFFDLNRRFTHEVVQVCREAIERGEFRGDVSPALLRDLFFGAIEHRTWAFLRGEGDFSSEKVADGIADVICRGMASSAAVAVPPSPVEAPAARAPPLSTTSAGAALAAGRPDGPQTAALTAIETRLARIELLLSSPRE